MSRPFPELRRFVWAAAVVLLCACQSEEEPAATAETAAATPAAENQSSAQKGYVSQATAQITPGLHARISGVVNQQLESPGAYAKVPRRKQRAGYHFVGDGDKENGLDLSLIMPDYATGGVYPLSATSPFDTGKRFEAKLETKAFGNFIYNTQGYLTLNQLQVQDNGKVLASGSFTFGSQNEKGEQVVVEGEFNLDIAPD